MKPTKKILITMMVKIHNLTRIPGYMNAMVAIKKWTAENLELKRSIQEEERGQQLGHN